MRLDDERESGNIEDRRGAGGGGGRGFRVGGIGGILLILGAMYFGVDPRIVMNFLDMLESPHSSAPAQQASSSSGGAPADDAGRQFTARVLASTEDVWGSYFRQMNRTYHDPGLVLFTGRTQSGCGFAQTVSGPFYCPADQKIYLDLAFFQELQNHLGARGNAAQAYVIAHEVGHHVQDELGILRHAGSSAGAAGSSVRTELQADCLAGVWARRADQARGILESGDVENSMNAAAAVGDDRLQKQAQGYAVPDSFTHGTSAQRARWFRRGLDSGDIGQCDTFSASSL
ncbi:neutral zinc metallopeptidase [Acetobacter sp. AN02]|uniref:KPN_02809 family neutral zinc metallopeptidase n=1 Tax=Acetobacter sp. AN02 TaxID=2894186 RepID=UPI00243454F6|nr:zinc metallopeptidase [Acetobacter sp. AN02]MDG6093530.1 neutral zinc metallopeptidase [Acetobacter sp. AN02]